MGGILISYRNKPELSINYLGGGIDEISIPSGDYKNWFWLIFQFPAVSSIHIS